MPQENIMCQWCSDPTATHATVPRRGFLTLAGAAIAGLAITRDGFAEAPKAPPKKENILSPEAALNRLMKGNERYVEGVSKRHDFKHEREALTKGQNPFAGILSCADSRIAPEYAFDTGRGDLFVCRVAGNFLNTDVVASFEYAVSVLNTPLLMVLGHRSCGAVEATIKSIRDGTTLPGRSDRSRRQGHAGQAGRRPRQRHQAERPSQCRSVEGRDAHHRGVRLRQ
jgi:carbonic anhydrase